MLASERRDLLLDIQDRLLDLYVRRDEAGRTGDWQLADLIDEEISEARVQRSEICDRDMGENP
jgi:hypothetical protein